MIKITDVWACDFNLFVDDIVNNIESMTMVILDCLNEADHYDRAFNKQDIDRLLSVTCQHNVPVKILTSNPNKNPALNQFSNVSVICWATFWFERTYRVWLKHDEYNQTKGIDIKDDNVCKNFELTHPYICLNNIVKEHRSIMMDMLAKHDLIKHGKLTWRGISHSQNHHYQFKYWKPEILILDQNTDVLFNQETMPIEFNHAFMQVVTETEDTETFLTEKTATPILLNKPFLIATNCGFHTMLEKMGFQLYTELFDYSFDTDMDIFSRYEKIAENVKRYAGLSPTELKQHYDSVLDKITHNRKLALKYASMVPDDIVELHKLVKKNNIEYVGPLNNITYLL
jgi:hypothetical protein